MRRTADTQQKMATRRKDEDDHLLHMDPSLMTERQQLAFLLRTTAHEASDGSHASSEDEKMRPMKKRRRTRRSEQPRRGPGRPPKNSKSADSKLRVVTHKQAQEKREAKPSPTGSDDVVQLGAFAHGAPRCALCCDYDTAHEASALFLCPACDQKYPTQQALDRRACLMTTQ